MAQRGPTSPLAPPSDASAKLIRTLAVTVFEQRYLPEGVGFELPKNSDIVMQVHYHRNGRAEKDRTRVGLYFAKKKIDLPYQAGAVVGGSGTGPLRNLFAIPAVGMFREVRHGDHAELADFLQGVHLGIAEEIRAITDVIRAWGSTPFVAGGMLVPSFGAIATARGLRRGIPTVTRVRRRWSAWADGAARGRVAHVAGVSRIVGKGVARH